MKIRTDILCTECSVIFIAQLDFSIDGNHIVECPHCGHEHCRVIKDGKVTGDRWSTRDQRVEVEKKHIWKSDSLPMITNTAGEFLRQRWLNLVQSGKDGDILKNLEDLSGDLSVNELGE
jgi:DNA-directed RNA polymerase subunit RPC12/RpoP